MKQHRVLLPLAILAAIALGVGGGVAFASASGGRPSLGGTMPQSGFVQSQPIQSQQSQGQSDMSQWDAAQAAQGRSDAYGPGNCPDRNGQNGQNGQKGQTAPNGQNAPNSSNGSNL